MTEEIIIAGFGGQGVLSMGKIMAYSGVMQEMEVSWMPSYGPEMRGGTANVTVIISDDRISSPIIKVFDSAIILNQQSLDKFEPAVKPGGTLILEVPLHTDKWTQFDNAAGHIRRYEAEELYDKLTTNGFTLSKFSVRSSPFNKYTSWLAANVFHLFPNFGVNFSIRFDMRIRNYLRRRNGISWYTKEFHDADALVLSAEFKDYDEFRKKFGPPTGQEPIHLAVRQISSA